MRISVNLPPHANKSRAIGNATTRLATGFSAQSYASQAGGRMWPCKIFSPNRTKMFHVKQFGTIGSLISYWQGAHYRASRNAQAFSQAQARATRHPAQRQRDRQGGRSRLACATLFARG